MNNFKKIKKTFISIILTGAFCVLGSQFSTKALNLKIIMSAMNIARANPTEGNWDEVIRLFELEAKAQDEIKARLLTNIFKLEAEGDQTARLLELEAKDQENKGHHEIAIEFKIKAVDIRAHINKSVAVRKKLDISYILKNEASFRYLADCLELQAKFEENKGNYENAINARMRAANILARATTASEN